MSGFTSAACPESCNRLSTWQRVVAGGRNPWGKTRKDWNLREVTTYYDHLTVTAGFPVKYVHVHSMVWKRSEKLSEPWFFHGRYELFCNTYITWREDVAQCASSYGSEYWNPSRSNTFQHQRPHQTMPNLLIYHPQLLWCKIKKLSSYPSKKFAHHDI